MNKEHVLYLLQLGHTLRWRRMDGWVMYWWPGLDEKRPRERTINALMDAEKVIHVGSLSGGHVRLLEDSDII